MQQLKPGPAPPKTKRKTQASVAHVLKSKPASEMWIFLWLPEAEGWRNQKDVGQKTPHFSETGWMSSRDGLHTLVTPGCGIYYILENSWGIEF